MISSIFVLQTRSAVASHVLGVVALAIGMALVNSIGNLAGFGAPSLIGWLRQLKNGTTPTLIALAGFAIMAVAVLLIVQRRMPAYR